MRNPVRTQLKEILNKAEQNDLATQITDKKYTELNCKILLLVIRKQEILLSFICGFIANLPISVLFNVLTIDISHFDVLWLKVVYFAAYFICLTATAFLTVFAFQFTIKYASIKGDNLPNKVSDCCGLNESYYQGKTPLKYLTEKAKLFIAFAIISVITVVALFILNLL